MTNLEVLLKEEASFIQDNILDMILHSDVAPIPICPNCKTPMQTIIKDGRMTCYSCGSQVLPEGWFVVHDRKVIDCRETWESVKDAAYGFGDIYYTTVLSKPDDAATITSFTYQHEEPGVPCCTYFFVSLSKCPHCGSVHK